VVLAYSLGKAQEATCLLAASGYRLLVHPAIAAIHRLYEREGVPLGPWEPWPPGDPAGAVLLLPPDARHGALVAQLRRQRPLHTIMLTGWGLDPSARYRYRVDEVIPLSDHADWTELVDYVERARPRRVYTVHGFPDLASYLRSRGVDAVHLPDHQPPLFDQW
jgi:Cft2 family RNA processing exonuclease